MECISIFDMLKIGVGPSSSHTLGGPWIAAERWIQELQDKEIFTKVRQVKVHVYGSLSLTGKGHATDYAIMLGLSGGADPVTIPEKDILPTIHKIQESQKIHLGLQMEIPFSPLEDICFHKKFLEFHANGLKFEAVLDTGEKKSKTYYSIGGGFVVVKERKNAKKKMADFHKFPFPIENGQQLLAHCDSQECSISSLVLKNERSLRTNKEIDTGIQSVWTTMLNCMYNGCHTEGKLPGGLNVTRRAADLNKNLLSGNYKQYENAQGWLKTIRKTKVKFRQIFKWVSCFALAVNEVNASLGRVVTAPPTNGSAGVIPSVLMYYLVIENHKAGFEHIKQFLLVAGEIGSIFKKGATISAAWVAAKLK